MADNFTYVTADYNTIYNTYVDEHDVVKIKEKEAQLGNIGKLVAGDVNSQFITFEINRYYDNIDLSTKMIKISYMFKQDNRKIDEYHQRICYNYRAALLEEDEFNNSREIAEDEKMYSDNACNICYSDDKVRFSWLVDAAAGLQDGTLVATVSFIGVPATEKYNLQIVDFELTINPSIVSNHSVEEQKPVNWFEDVESRIYRVEQATGGATLDYLTLANKPSINGVELQGDMVLDYVSGIASSSNLGGVKAVEKTAEMTYAVGIDSDGYLWTKPGTGGGSGGGEDGFSPVVTMTSAEDGSGTTLGILDKNGLKTAFIKNGIDGKDGIDGVDGTNGNDGIDGVSPTVTVTEVTDGTQIVITDKDGSKVTVIPNGKDGKDGKDGEDGAALIDDTATSGTDKSWSIDKIKSYVTEVLEGIENGTY